MRQALDEPLGRRRTGIPGATVWVATSPKHSGLYRVTTPGDPVRRPVSATTLSRQRGLAMLPATPPRCWHVRNCGSRQRMTEAAGCSVGPVLYASLQHHSVSKGTPSHEGNLLPHGWRPDSMRTLFSPLVWHVGLAAMEDSALPWASTTTPKILRVDSGIGLVRMYAASQVLA